MTEEIVMCKSCRYWARFNHLDCKVGECRLAEGWDFDPEREGVKAWACAIETGAYLHTSPDFGCISGEEGPYNP